MDGWDWLWMTFVMGLGLVLIGAVAYAAIRIAQRPPRQRHPVSGSFGYQEEGSWRVRNDLVPRGNRADGSGLRARPSRDLTGRRLRRLRDLRDSERNGEPDHSCRSAGRLLVAVRDGGVARPLRPSLPYAASSRSKKRADRARRARDVPARPKVPICRLLRPCRTGTSRCRP
jgi:hypothetical protein